MNAKAGRFEVKVYYEDVDSLSVVYYANYLKYFERGRSEFFANAGFAPWSLNDQGVLVAVYKADLTFSAPARLGDTCEVVTSIVSHTPLRVVLEQNVVRGDTRLVKGLVTLVFLDRDLKLREAPPDVSVWLKREWPNE
jgi:tol-pal system-associated acyl-CoA thioesterase